MACKIYSTTLRSSSYTYCRASRGTEPGPAGNYTLRVTVNSAVEAIGECHNFRLFGVLVLSEGHHL